MISECPEISAEQIKYRIITYKDAVNSLVDKCASNGRLNAYKAVSNAHSYSFARQDATYHTATCPCGESKVEKHTFVLVAGVYICKHCGYVK